MRNNLVLFDLYIFFRQTIFSDKHLTGSNFVRLKNILFSDRKIVLRFIFKPKTINKHENIKVNTYR